MLFNYIRSHVALILRRYSAESIEMVRVLNVAEKNDAAKSLSDVMSRGGYRKREGYSKFNKIYEYNYNIFNKNCTMTMTSVSGHLLGLEFIGQYRKWNTCSPVSLFDIPVEKYCPDNFKDIKRTLEKEVRGCQYLVIWTDGDREGENIGFEIIQVCLAVKPNIPVYRARFSEITPNAVLRAVNNLCPPDKNTSDAVDVRQELDLRIGAAFTRFQTLRLQKVFPQQLAEQLISYGSCQFPTLGFVVERYKQIQDFIAEPFWKLKVTHKLDDIAVDFTWKRNRLFNHLACLVLYENCIENPTAEVTDVKSKSKSKWRPQALDTVELEKLASRKLKINAKETMKIAEKLYTQGFISYPRTETNMFPKDLDLVGLINEQTRDDNWGEFAQRILERGGPHPRNGHKTDNAHPPIHPTKYTATLQGNEQRVYEFIVRHFLACCSEDAQGHETTVDIMVAEEEFSAQGLMILARNYLDVYPYEKWNAKEIPIYDKGDSFQPNSIEMNCGETSPPQLLSEADLISLMDKHGIGTDATHAEHIETVKSRMYVGVRPDGRFLPGQLGMGLVEGYDSMGYPMSKPHLRAELESDLKDICDGKKDKNVVRVHQIQKYKEVFVEACNQALKLDEALSQYLGEASTVEEASVMNQEVMKSVRPCAQCGQDMILKTKKDNKGFYISCMGYPNCRSAIWFPDFVLDVSVEESKCSQCQPLAASMLKFKFKRGSAPPMLVSESSEYVGCIGCDVILKESLGITDSQLTQRNVPARSAGPTAVSQFTPNDSGYGSTFGGSSTLPTQSTQHTALSNQTFLGTNNSALRTPASSNRNNSNSSNARNKKNVSNTEGNSSSKRLSVLNTSNTGMNRGSGDGENNIVCNCGDDAVLLTVRKEGPNTGRQFYKCTKPSGTGCNFFLWADESPAPTDNSRQRQNSAFPPNQNLGGSFQQPGTWAANRNRNDNNFSGGLTSNAEEVNCNCGQQAKRLTVQKEGPNKGRQFYACPKPRGEGCNFFQWGDDSGNESTGTGNRNVGTESKSKKRPATGGNTSAPKRRKCSNCGEEGHTKKTCPLNR